MGFPHSWSLLPLALIRTWPLQFVVTSVECSDIGLIEVIHTQVYMAEWLGSLAPGYISKSLLRQVKVPRMHGRTL